MKQTNLSKRTGSYVGTVLNNEEGLAEIKALRDEMKVSNAAERAKVKKNGAYQPSINRVMIFGRMGKNNPNAEKYKDMARTHKNSLYGASPYQYIAKADAQSFDIYIGPRMG